MPNFRSLASFGWKETKELSRRLLLPNGFDGYRSIQGLAHEGFRLDKASGLIDPALNTPLQLGRFEGFLFGPAIVWPAAGGIADMTGALVKESFENDHFFRQARQHRLLKKFPLQSSDAPWVTCIGHIHRNYYHRYIDSIPRLYALHHPRLRELPTIELLLDPRFSDQDREVIECLIPDNVRIRRVPYDSRIRVIKYIHLPYFSGKRHDVFKFNQNCAGYLPQDYLNFFRKRMYNHWGLNSEPTGRRIYISRKDARIRRIENEAEVIRFLENFGFENHTLTGLSLREQARMFAEAEVILTMHGAALTNILYANPAAKVIEIFPKHKFPVYSTLADALGIRHISLVQKGEDKNVDLKLPLAKLLRTLHKVDLDKVNILP